MMIPASSISIASAYSNDVKWRARHCVHCVGDRGNIVPTGAVHEQPAGAGEQGDDRQRDPDAQIEPRVVDRSSSDSTSRNSAPLFRALPVRT